MTPTQHIVEDNIRRKLEMLGLWDLVYHIDLVLDDRVLLNASARILPRLNYLVTQQRMSRDPTWMISAAHDHARAFYAERFPERRPETPIFTTRYSYRETRHPSLQIVLAVGPDGKLYGDADIDLGSWSADVVGFFRHVVEVVWPGPTNHRRLARRIEREYERWRRGEEARA